MDAITAMFERAQEQLRQEFLDHAGERLDAIEASLLSGRILDGEAVMAIYRDVHGLKGNGATFGLPSLGIVADRLESYIAALTHIDARAARDMIPYIDALRRMINSGRDIGNDALRETLRGLPGHRPPDFDVDAPLEVEILLITPSNAVGQYVSLELKACGYRVTQAHSPWQAIQLAACTRPDLIISSVVLDGLSGVDLVHALGVMEPTATIPVAVLTSFDKGHKALAGLPQTVPVIRSGKPFRDDLAETLSQLGIC